MMQAFWPWLMVAALSSASGAGVAWMIASERGNARLMQCEQMREKEARAAAEIANALLVRAQDAESSAARRLADKEQSTRTRLEHTRRELYALSTGRACLPNTIRVRLNATLAGNDLPASSGGAFDAAAESSADPGHGDDGRISTDADVAGWIVDAAERFEQCRARLDAIRQWDAMTFEGENGR